MRSQGIASGLTNRESDAVTPHMAHSSRVSVVLRDKSRRQQVRFEVAQTFRFAGMPATLKSLSKKSRLTAETAEITVRLKADTTSQMTARYFSDTLLGILCVLGVLGGSFLGSTPTTPGKTSGFFSAAAVISAVDVETETLHAGG